MSDKPSAAWYLAPIFLGIIGSAIMWFVLKDEDHPDSKKMIKKGWIIGIVLTIIPFLIWIPMMVMMPFAFMGVDQQHMQQPASSVIERLVPQPGVSLDLEHATSSYSNMNKLILILDDFRNTSYESQDIDTIFFKFGDPSDDIGSGIHIYVYELKDSNQIWIGYSDKILYVHHVDVKGNVLETLFKNE